MLQLSEELYNYLEFTIPDPMKPNVMSGFDLLFKFQLAFLEDKYFNLMYSDDPVDSTEAIPLLIDLLSTDLEYIIENHGIILNDFEDGFPRLEVLIKVTSGLYELLHLEDYSVIERILSNSSSVELKVCMMIEFLTGYEDFLLLEKLEQVDENLLLSLLQLIQQSKDQYVEVDLEPNNLTAFFMKYLGDHSALGKEIFDRGFDKPFNLDDIINLTTLDIKGRLRESMIKGPSWYGIDMLSLMMLGKDTREQPIEAFNRYKDIYFDESRDITIYLRVMNEQYADFCNYLKQPLKEIDDEQPNHQ